MEQRPHETTQKKKIGRIKENKQMINSEIWMFSGREKALEIKESWGTDVKRNVCICLAVLYNFR